MQADDLLKIIQSPYNISTTDVAALKQVVARYPYFQLARTLVAKGIHDQDSAKAQYAIQLAAIYAPDRNRLKLLLENKLGYTNLVQSVAKATDALKHAKQPSTAEEARKDSAKPANSSSKIAKKPTPQKTSGQVHCIDQFINAPPGKLQLQADEELLLAATGKDLAAKDVVWQHTYLTETLARIMLQQDKFDKAIQIYQRLKDKFPEKRTYFDDIIAEITKSYNTDSHEHNL